MLMAAVFPWKEIKVPGALVVPAGAAIEADGAALVIRPARRMAKHADQDIGISAATRDAATAVEQSRRAAATRRSGSAAIGFSWPVQPGRPVRSRHLQRTAGQRFGLRCTSSRSKRAPRALQPG
jgi:hypothetical protein